MDIHSKIIAINSPAEIVAAAGKKNPTFNVTAYTGGPLAIKGWDLPVVIDLAGLAFRRNVVANLDHDRTKRVGHVVDRVIEGNTLKLAGVLSAATPFRDEVVKSAANGFRWEASIEVSPSKVDEIGDGQPVLVNGRGMEGPLYVTRVGTLYAFAFVSHGADGDTEVSIAAEFADAFDELAESDHRIYTKLYDQLLEQRAQGYDVDPALGNSVLAMVGKSMDDWNMDVVEMQCLMAELGEI